MSAKNGQIKNCETCGHQMYVKKSLLKRKRFCSRSCLGKKNELEKRLSRSTVDSEIKKGTLTKEEKDDLKSFAIKRAVKLQKYVRN